MNAAFAVLVLLLASVGGSANPRILHLILLFAVCSNPIIDLDGLNGKFALHGIFLAFYFVSFGLGDFTNLMSGTSSEAVPSLFSDTEAVILAGAVMLTIGYRLTVKVGDSTPDRHQPRDWSMQTVLIVGFTMWFIGTVSMYYWGVYVITDTTIEAAKRGLGSLSPVGIMVYLLAGMFQPFGVLLIAYAWRMQRSRWLMPLIVVIVLLQVILGFILNIKSLAMTAGILVILTYVLIDGKLPKLWLAGAVVFMMVVFPIFQASRTEVHGNRHIARANILGNLGEVLGLAIAAEDRVNKGPERAQTLLERTSVRGSIQTIVQRTGVDVKFQNGYTLTPLLATFIPRIIWPDKFDVPTGRLVNKEFHLSEYEDTYISPSIPGELYWNFGWAGIIVGMTTIGAMVGFIGRRFNLARSKNVTSLLVVVLTIKQLIVGLEGTFSPEYVTWMRSLGAVALLHVLFARRPALAGGMVTASPPFPTQGASVMKPFLNLMQ